MTEYTERAWYEARREEGKRMDRQRAISSHKTREMKGTLVLMGSELKWNDGQRKGQVSLLSSECVHYIRSALKCMMMMTSRTYPHCTVVAPIMLRSIIEMCIKKGITRVVVWLVFWWPTFIGEVYWIELYRFFLWICYTDSDQFRRFYTGENVCNVTVCVKCWKRFGLMATKRNGLEDLCLSSCIIDDGDKWQLSILRTKPREVAGYWINFGMVANREVVTYLGLGRVVKAVLIKCLVVREYLGDWTQQ